MKDNTEAEMIAQHMKAEFKTFFKQHEALKQHITVRIVDLTVDVIPEQDYIRDYIIEVANNVAKLYLSVNSHVSWDASLQKVIIHYY